MKRHILAFLLTSLTLWVMAVPALRTRRSVTLDDGRIVMVTAFGDESFDYLLTDDGEVVTEEDNVFHGTRLSLEDYIKTLPSPKRSTRRKVGSVAKALVQPYGTKKIPVILAAFNDKQFSVARSETKVRNFYDRFFNGTDISSTGNWGSVRQYFIDQSQGQFQPEFTVIGPVQLDSVYSYYGKDNGGSKDVNYSTFVCESFTKAQAMQEDWVQFDNDGDGNVDMCVIIFAGLGQNYTNNYKDKNTIWPCEMPTSYTINGVTLSGCSSGCEQRPTAANDSVITATQPDGVGLIVHEISHAIGLPDLYDTNNRAFGMDFWSVMDYGMYTRSSKCPVGYTAYEREFLGWQQTETITGPCTLHLYPFAQGGKGYKLVNDANSNEYYILDNRQAVEWDWGMCNIRGHGMLVMHIDYKSDRWETNTVNTSANHQLMTIIPANSSFIGSNNYSDQNEWQTSLQGNPYPGITENHELTNYSEPASLVYKGTYMNKPLVDIQETEDGVVTVKVMPLGTLAIPTGLVFEDVNIHNAKAVWDEVENAELYNLQLWSDGELVFQQDSIAGNSYNLTELQPNKDYTYTVQAISDSYLNSEWAESENFRDIIDCISEMTESTELVRIYDINGCRVGDCFADELHRIVLSHGIYIIRRNNGKTKKIMF